MTYDPRVTVQITDPTKASLELFNDPSRWVVVPNVPIFIPHQRKKKGKVLYTIDNDALKTIGDEMIKLEAESGVLPKIQIGHTHDSGDETAQPKIVGYAKNLKFGVWGPTNKPGLLANLYYRKEDFQLAKDFPFRSPEYYPGRETITAVALLKQDPELDMGMLIFSRLDEREDYHHLEEQQKHEVVKMAESEAGNFKTMPATPEEEHHKEQDALPNATEVKEMLEHYNRHFKQHYARHGGLPHPQHHAEHYASAAHAEFHPLHGASVSGGPTEPDMVKNQAGAGPGVASPTNVAPPVPQPQESDVQRMQREQEAIKYRKQEERLAAVEAELAAEKYARRLATMERAVIQLEAEGRALPYERSVFVEKLAKLSDDDANERLDFVRRTTNNTRQPLGQGMLALHRGPVEGSTPATTREQMNAATSLASRKGMSFDDALKEIKAAG